MYMEYCMRKLVFLCVEAFVVCQGYHPPEGYTPTMANPLLDHKYSKSMEQ